MSEETLVPLDLSDAIAMIDRQRQRIDELTAEKKRQSEEIRLLRRALGNCNPDHNLLVPEEALQDEKGEGKWIDH